MKNFIKTILISLAITFSVAGIAYASLPLGEVPNVVALFETSLASKISSTSTTMTLVSGTDKSGNSLSGIYGFIIDEGTASEEFVIGDATGTSVISMLRGISVTDGTTEVSALKKEHRRGASVKITSFPFLGIIYRLVSGIEAFPSSLSYVAHPTFTSNTELIDKKYADDLAIAGSPDMSTTIKGIGEEATAAEITAGTATGGTGARLIVNPNQLQSSIYYTQLPSSDQKNALAGTSGTPSTSNKYVTADDVSAAAASDKIVRSSGTSLPALDGSSLTGLSIRKSFTAGETLTGATLPQPVFVARSSITEVTHKKETNDGSAKSTYGVAWYAQTFTTSAHTTRLSKADLWLKKTGSPSGDMVAAIYAVDGTNKPTGAALVSKNVTASSASTLAAGNWLSFTFASALTVTPSTRYALVFSVTSGDVSNYVDWYYTAEAFTGGQYGDSGDSGSTWTMDSNKVFQFRMYGYEALTAGRIYATQTNEVNRNFIDGYAVSNASAAAAVTVQLSGVVSGFTGLTANTKYYGTDTVGTISTTAGTFKTFAGKSLTTTDILFTPENTDKNWLNTQLFVNTTPLLRNYRFYHNLGRIPSYVKVTAFTGANDSTSSVGIYDPVGATYMTVWNGNNTSPTSNVDTTKLVHLQTGGSSDVLLTISSLTEQYIDLTPTTTSTMISLSSILEIY